MAAARKSRGSRLRRLSQGALREDLASEVGSGDEHPTPTSDGANPIGAETAPDPDDEGVAPALAQVGDAGPSGQLAPAEHSTGVGLQDVVHSPLLRCQMLEGVRIRLLTLGGLTGAGRAMRTCKSTRSRRCSLV